MQYNGLNISLFFYKIERCNENVKFYSDNHQCLINYHWQISLYLKCISSFFVVLKMHFRLLCTISRNGFVCSKHTGNHWQTHTTESIQKVYNECCNCFHQMCNPGSSSFTLRLLNAQKQWKFFKLASKAFLFKFPIAVYKSKQYFY